MIDVLTELSLVHAARNYSKQKLEATGINPDQYILDKFNIDSLQFERSSDYYTEQYSQYERIYDSVKVRLQVIKSRLDSIREVEVKIEDSIKQARKDSIKAADSLKLKPSKLKLDERDSIRTRKSDIKKLKQGKDNLILPPAAVSRKRS
jgi:hypothetical protein